jgi:hypothetical protein
MEGSLANPLQQTQYSTTTQKTMTLSNEMIYEESPKSNTLTKKRSSNMNFDADAKIVKKS